MPYTTIANLPQAVGRLPAHAQEIFRSAFNAAWHGEPGAMPERREDRALWVAWAAVKMRWGKEDGVWAAKPERR